MSRADEEYYEDKVFAAMAKANVVNKLVFEAKAADGSQPVTLFYTAALKASANAVTDACGKHFPHPPMQLFSLHFKITSVLELDVSFLN